MHLENPKQRIFHGLTLTVMLLGLVILTTGCGNKYLQNRCDDFRDVFNMGIGVTASEESPYPPGMGLYLEMTDYFHLGAMRFHGYMAEWDRRGCGLKTLDETKLGFGPFHKWCIDEKNTCAGMYKSGKMTKWERRMEERTYTELIPTGNMVSGTGSKGHPGKRMRFEDAILYSYPRGWQDWGFVGADVAVSEPFLLHIGLKFRAGVDLSQIMDFTLGLFTIDFYGDDCTDEELAEASE